MSSIPDAKRTDAMPPPAAFRSGRGIRLKLDSIRIAEPLVCVAFTTFARRSLLMALILEECFATAANWHSNAPSAARSAARNTF